MNFSSMIRRDQQGISHFLKKSGTQVDSHKSSYGVCVCVCVFLVHDVSLIVITFVVLFMRDGNNFRVLPVKDWFKFTGKPRHKILSIEEAEEEMKGRKRAVQRWHMKKILIGEKGGDDEDEKPKKKLMKFGKKAKTEQLPDDEDDAFTVGAYFDIGHRHRF